MFHFSSGLSLLNFEVTKSSNVSVIWSLIYGEIIVRDKPIKEAVVGINLVYALLMGAWAAKVG